MTAVDLKSFYLKYPTQAAAIVAAFGDKPERCLGPADRAELAAARAALDETAR